MQNLVLLAAQAGNEPAAMTQGELIAWIAGIATAVATVVTAAMTLWFRMMDTPQPEFEAVPLYHRWENGDYGPLQLPEHTLAISNVGSGAARIVSFMGLHATVYVKKNDLPVPKGHDAIFEVGQTISITTRTMPSRWDDAQLIMTWAEDSHLFWWRRYKHKTFSLAELFETPVLMEKSTNPISATVESQRVSEDSPLHRQIQELERKLEKSGTVVLAKSTPRASRKQLRKLSKAGWRWRQYLTKTNPDEADS